MILVSFFDMLLCVVYSKADDLQSIRSEDEVDEPESVVECTVLEEREREKREAV